MEDVRPEIKAALDSMNWEKLLEEARSQRREVLRAREENKPSEPARPSLAGRSAPKLESEPLLLLNEESQEESCELYDEDLLPKQAPLKQSLQADRQDPDRRQGERRPANVQTPRGQQRQNAGVEKSPPLPPKPAASGKSDTMRLVVSFGDAPATVKNPQDRMPPANDVALPSPAPELKSLPESVVPAGNTARRMFALAAFAASLALVVGTVFLLRLPSPIESTQFAEVAPATYARYQPLLVPAIPDASGPEAGLFVADAQLRARGPKPLSTARLPEAQGPDVGMDRLFIASIQPVPPIDGDIPPSATVAIASMAAGAPDPSVASPLGLPPRNVDRRPLGSQALEGMKATRPDLAERPAVLERSPAGYSRPVLQTAALRPPSEDGSPTTVTVPAIVTRVLFMRGETSPRLFIPEAPLIAARSAIPSALRHYQPARSDGNLALDTAPAVPASLDAAAFPQDRGPVRLATPHSVGPIPMEIPQTVPSATRMALPRVPLRYETPVDQPQMPAPIGTLTETDRTAAISLAALTVGTWEAVVPRALQVPNLTISLPQHPPENLRDWTPQASPFAMLAPPQIDPQAGTRERPSPAALPLERIPALPTIESDPAVPGGTPHRQPGLPGADAYSIIVNAPNSVPDPVVSDAEGAIATLGLPMRPVRRVAFRVSWTQVRYFKDDDVEVARALADVLGAELRDFTTMRPSPPAGVIEVYIAGRSSTRPARSAVRGTPRVSETTRLRNRLINQLRNGVFR